MASSVYQVNDLHNSGQLPSTGDVLAKIKQNRLEENAQHKSMHRGPQAMCTVFNVASTPLCKHFLTSQKAHLIQGVGQTGHQLCLHKVSLATLELALLLDCEGCGFQAEL